MISRNIVRMNGFVPVRHARLAASLVAMATATAPFALEGTVTNKSGAVITRAVVFYLSDTATRQFTDTLGRFALAASTGVARAGSSGSMEQGIERLAVRDGRLAFHLATAAREGTVSVFSSDGTKRFGAALTTLSAGAHEVAVPSFASGLYFVRFTLDGRTADKRMILTVGAGQEPRSLVAHQVPGSRDETSSGGALARGAATTARTATAAIDTLVVRRIGYVTEKVPVTSYAATGVAVAMTPDTLSLQPPVSDYSQNGPFATVIESNVGPGNNYTIVRPAVLGANGFRHPPIIYGHGINAQVSGFTTFLGSVASHGFVIIARNVLTGGPNNAGNTAAMNDGLAWILAQDTTPGSIYFGKLATNRAAAMGYSVGGTAAVDIGGHPSLQTVVSIHGHISSATLNGTLLQTSGTLDNVGLPMQQQTYANSEVQTFLGTVTGANHGYIQSNNGGVQRAAIIAWLRFWLYNDQGGKPYFYGPTCVMCSPVWENPQRKYWN